MVEHERFPCSGCGACCRSIGAVLEGFARNPEGHDSITRGALMAFPYKALDDGRCDQLGEDGRCQVYETRPLICRVDLYNRQVLPALSALERWQLTATACDSLQEMHGVEARFRMLPVIQAIRDAKATG